MKLYVAVYTCKRDEHLSLHKAETLDLIGCTRPYYFYYGMDEPTPPPCLCENPQLPTTVLECVEEYENFPVKTYGLCKHALETDDTWTHLLKTDVNRTIFYIDWEKASEADFAGMVLPWEGGREYRFAEFHEPILREPYLGPLSKQYCGGPAYIISRRLAKLIVERGVWAARSMKSEDMYVGLVAEQNGIVPVPAIRYYEDGGTISNFMAEWATPGV